MTSDLVSKDDVIHVIHKYFYNLMTEHDSDEIDDFMSEDAYCENHCSDGCYGECWKRFFEKYDKFLKESEEV